MAEKANNINMLNAIRNMQDLSYQDRIPVATKDNILKIYENLLNVVPLRNAFCEALITQVMMQRIETGYFENPLVQLKKDPMRYGMTEEEIFVNFARGYEFNEFATTADLFKFYQANVMSAYHRLSPPMQYAVTVSYDNLRNAFTSEYGVRDLINAKVQSLFNGANWDEYLIMKSLAESAYANGQVYPVACTAPTDEKTAKDFTIKLKGIIRQMQFPHPEYTIAGADSPCTKGSIFMFVTPEVDAQLDVNVLAYAFNNDFAMLDVHKIVVDSFADSNIQAIVFDMRFYNVRENFRTMSDSRNGAALSWNYFYTVSEMFSYSPFFQCVALTTADIAKTPAVTFPGAADIHAVKGTTTQIPIKITGADGKYTSKTYIMEVVDSKGTRTNVIPGSNYLYVANDYPAASVDIKATLLAFPDITATVTINVG